MLFIREREKEREHDRVCWGRSREKGKNRLPTEQGAHVAQSQNPGIMT